MRVRQRCGRERESNRFGKCSIDAERVRNRGEITDKCDK